MHSTPPQNPPNYNLQKHHLTAVFQHSAQKKRKKKHIDIDVIIFFLSIIIIFGEFIVDFQKKIVLLQYVQPKSCVIMYNANP